MPLVLSSVTSASRIMLPWYVIMYAILGLLFILQDPERTSGIAFQPARAMWSITTWGVLFLVIATIEGVALVIHKRNTYLIGLVLGAGMAAFWGFLLVSAGIKSPEVSFTSAVWVIGWVAAHAASARSVAWREHR